MITGVSIVTVWVLDPDSAKEFYTKQLGFDLTNDILLDGGMRWLTVRSSGGQEFLLLDPAHSMLDSDTGVQVRALVAKGALSPGVLATTDCRADYETLVERGVEFIQAPAERPYGIEAILRDDSGNWFSFTQAHYLAEKNGG
ncbi:MAG: VOC family protein [Streptosporangiaceae bacterium]